MRARIGALLAVMIVLGLWSTALASGFSGTFSVTYSGAGTLNSKIKSITSPQCGEVTEVRDETTHFSWATHFHPIDLVVDRYGLQHFSTHAPGERSSLASNDSTVTLTDTGCQSGHADCSGESDPEPGNSAQLEIPAAAESGRSRLKVEAVGGTEGYIAKGFSGDWDFTSGTCAIDFNNGPLLVPEFDVPSQLTASFPVKVATLEHLKVGHYFKVKIDPGHYAPAQSNSCSPDDGCLQDDFHWHGVVEVDRTG